MDNIRLSKPEATETDVIDACKRLDCLDVFQGLPEGLRTEVGERGAGLSVGQRQLICFSRALLADPRIMILDEATSSIDALTEARLQKALVTLLQGRTSFIVAHRLSTIRHAIWCSCWTRGGSSSGGRIRSCWPLAGKMRRFIGSLFRWMTRPDRGRIGSVLYVVNVRSNMNELAVVLGLAKESCADLRLHAPCQLIADRRC